MNEQIMTSLEFRQAMNDGAVVWRRHPEVQRKNPDRDPLKETLRALEDREKLIDALDGLPIDIDELLQDD